jgi:hypothetical protein
MCTQVTAAAEGRTRCSRHGSAITKHRYNSQRFSARPQQRSLSPTRDIVQFLLLQGCPNIVKLVRVLDIAKLAQAEFTARVLQQLVMSEPHGDGPRGAPVRPGNTGLDTCPRVRCPPNAGVYGTMPSWAYQLRFDSLPSASIMVPVALRRTNISSPLVQTGWRPGRMMSQKARKSFTVTVQLQGGLTWVVQSER